MSKIDQAIANAKAIADNNSIGYSQVDRWNMGRDCSSLMIDCWERAGVPVKTNGATYTGNMYNVFLRCGFKDVTGTVNKTNASGMIAGDVLLNHINHTAMYLGNKQIVHASSDRDGVQGDSSGREICVASYYNYPWDVVLRYEEAGSSSSTSTATTPTVTQTTIPTYSVQLPNVRYGDDNATVRNMQALLNAHGARLEVDGEFGPATKTALISFQSKCGLSADGICGPLTWVKLITS